MGLRARARARARAGARVRVRAGVRAEGWGKSAPGSAAPSRYFPLRMPPLSTLGDRGQMEGR